MELYADLLRGLVADRHRHSIDRGMNMEAGGGIWRAQRMVTADLDRVRHAGERSSRVVVEQGCLAVDGFGRANDLAAGFKDHRLMAKADAKEWHFPIGEPHEIHAAAGVRGAARTGGRGGCWRPPAALAQPHLVR